MLPGIIPVKVLRLNFNPYDEDQPLRHSTTTPGPGLCQPSVRSTAGAFKGGKKWRGRGNTLLWELLKSPCEERP